MNESEKSPVFMFQGDDPQLIAAYARAKETFRYFWRELSWERRRIIPALDFAMIKLPFRDDEGEDGNSECEHMWVNEVEFDGDQLYGELINSPNWLKSVKKGDRVEVPFSHLEDWIMASNRVAYGAFSVNAGRKKMNTSERKSHDEAWGLDFGDPNSERLILEPMVKKKSFIEKIFGSKKRVVVTDGIDDHPMSVNMVEMYEAQLKLDPSIINSENDFGMDIFQSDSLAGNYSSVKLFLKYGADRNKRTKNGYTAEELARKNGWLALADYIKGYKG